MSMLTKQIGRIFAIGWSHAMEYRGEIAVWLVTSALTPLIALAVWYATLQGQGAQATQAILTYYILVIFIDNMTRSWRGVYITSQILEGKIIKYIIKPPVILWDHVANNLITKGIQLAIPLPLFILALALFPHFFAPAIYNPTHILLFIPSLLLAMVLHFCFDFAVGMLAFWLEDAQELHGYRFLLMGVASGILIPFSVMPDAVRTALSFLPFRYIISAPAEILLGQVTGTAALTLIATQLVWVVVLAALVRAEWIFGLRRYAVPGQ